MSADDIDSVDGGGRRGAADGAAAVGATSSSGSTPTEEDQVAQDELIQSGPASFTSGWRYWRSGFPRLVRSAPSSPAHGALDSPETRGRLREDEDAAEADAADML